MDAIVQNAITTVKRVMVFDKKNASVYIYNVEKDAYERMATRLKLTISAIGQAEVHVRDMSVTPLKDGEIMIIVQSDENTSGAIVHPYDLIDRKTLVSRTMSFTNAEMPRWIYDFSLVRLNDNRVLLLPHQTTRDTHTTTVYDLETSTWSTLGQGITIQTEAFCIALTGEMDGKVLICGGMVFADANRLCFIYDAATHTMEPTAEMNMVRHNHAGCLLENGNVFVHGGEMDGRVPIHLVRSTCEEFDIKTRRWKLLPTSSAPQREHAAINTHTGKILLMSPNMRMQGMVYDIETSEFTNIASLGVDSEFAYAPLMK